MLLDRIQSPEDRQRVARVMAAVDLIEPHHKKWCKKASHFYSLYRNYQDFRRTYESTNPRGQDTIFRDGQGEFGPEMFVPLCFRAVETIVPRMLAGRPVMNVLPRNEFSEPNVRPMKALIDSQQEQIDYELKLQTVAKDGLIYGLGVGKTQWRLERKLRTQLQRIAVPGGGGELQEVQVPVTVFDDPDFYAIDPFDFLVDPFCGDIKEAEYAIHRTWRTNTYLSTMAATGTWQNLDQVRDLDGLTDGNRYDEVWAERLRAGGRHSATERGVSRRAPLHEVLEFHDGDQVITVVDRKLCVQAGPNPHWHGDMPFQCYRPTQVTHELHGIGEIEPIEQLQEEMNTLRTQRRYNADLVLQRVFAFHDGLVEPGDIKFGPGVGIPVNGDPKELLFPIPVGDIPYSSYQEEDRISQDIDATTGINDALAGGDVSGETATAAQLGYSAASARIRNKLLRMELEVVVPGTRHFGLLNQQRIRDHNAREVRIPTLPMPGQPDRRWSWVQVGPDQLNGEFDYRCESLSSEPDNIPQDRNDAEMLWSMLAENQLVDQPKLVSAVLLKMGIDQPEAWLAPPDPSIPAETLDILAQAGVPPELLTQALAIAGGPDLTTGEAPEGRGANSQEGARPELPAPPQPPQPTAAGAGGGSE